MKITYLGHAAFLVEGTKKIIIDPFLIGNPRATRKPEELPKLDYVLITHDHEDHLGDAIKIAKQSEAKIVAIYEVINKYASQKEGIIAEKAVGMNIGGTFPDGEISISMTLAFHSSYVGHPAGFVIEMDGKKIYHAGDTALFSDMSLIGKKFNLDLALLPIGGHYTMHEDDAAEAVKLLKPKLSVPMHYNTWPIISADPKKFQKSSQPFKVKILKVDESLEV